MKTHMYINTQFLSYFMFFQGLAIVNDSTDHGDIGLFDMTISYLNIYLEFILVNCIVVLCCF